MSDQHDRLWKKVVSIGKNSTSPNTPTRSAFAPFPSRRGHSCGNWIFNDVFLMIFGGFLQNFPLTPNADLRRKRKWTRKLTLVQLWTTLPQIPMCVSYRQNDGHAHPYRIDSSNSDSGNNPNLPVSRVVVNCCIAF